MRHLTWLLIIIVLAACSAAPSSDDPTDSDDTPPPSAVPGDEWTLVIADGAPGGSGISVAEALGHGPTDDLVTVTGALFVDADGIARLCDAIAESFPPQCGGARILVHGLDLDTIADLQTEGDVSWAEGVTLFGSVE